MRTPIAWTMRLAELLDFFADRLKVQQRDAGVRYDLIDAVFALGGEDDLVRLLARVEALQQFVETPEGADLLAAYKRAANILKKEKWDLPRVMAGRGEQGIPQTGEEDPLVLVEEPAIAAAVAEMARARPRRPMRLPRKRRWSRRSTRPKPKAIKAVADEDFTAAMSALATLRGPIDAFFDKVTVNDPDSTIRARRLNLLARFRDTVHGRGFLEDRGLASALDRVSSTTPSSLRRSLSAAARSESRSRHSFSRSAWMRSSSSRRSTSVL